MLALSAVHRRAWNRCWKGFTIAAVATTLSTDLAAAQQVATSEYRTHTVRRGDTLWDLSRTYLGDPFLWPEIYRINTEVVENPHWIYPGEVLRIPGERQLAVVEIPQPAAAPEALTPEVESPLVAPGRPLAPPIELAPPPVIRMGQYLSAPWVDQRGGPRGPGRVQGSAEIPGIARAGERSRFQLYDRILVNPPVGSVAAEGDLYVTYRLGPELYRLGQVVIPTGVIEVVRAARGTEPAVGRLVRMFRDVEERQLLMPYDTAVVAGSGRPVAVADGPTGTIRWVMNQAVLPSVQHYVIVNLSEREGLQLGDELDLFEPRRARSSRNAATVPETRVGRAQIVRVTPYAATAVITAQQQPKIEEGTGVRVSARIP